VLTEPEGPGAAEEGLRMLFTAFPDLYADVRQVVDDGDCVAVRFELSGTNTGDYRYLPAPTGRRAVWEAIGIFRIADGKIAEIWGTADRLGMLTQLGLLPDLG
jgi:predicted ester cyclase